LHQLFHTTRSSLSLTYQETFINLLDSDVFRPNLDRRSVDIYKSSLKTQHDTSDRFPITS